MSASTTIEPSVEEVEGYNTDALITVLNGKNFGLNENEIQIIREQGIDGASFLMLNEKRFKECNIRIGPRAKLVNWNNNLNNQRQGDFPNLNSLKDVVEEIVRGLDFKMEQGFNKIRHAIEEAIYSPGTDLTGTENGKTVMDKGTHIVFPLKWTTSSKRSGNERFTNSPNRNVDPKEEEVQQYFINECKELDKTSNIKNKLIVVDKHSSPSLGTRKSDFLFISKGSHLNMLNVVAVGEIQKRGSDNFNSAQIGQAISFGEKVLQLQPRRTFVYVILTDSIVINIYVVHRVDQNTHSNPTTKFTYQYITPAFLEFSGSNDADNTGWKLLVTIMESSPNILGWVEPSLKFGNNTVNLVRSIGVGRTSVVYQGKHDDALIAVKVAKKANYLPCFEKEYTALNDLSSLNSIHIPKILFNSVDALVISQVCERIGNLRKKDIKDIISTLEKVHSLNYVHRDLRKYNLVRDQLGNIVIIDWGYSIKLEGNHNFAFAGALECMPDNILQSIVNDDDINYGPGVDLTCLVHSFYLMLHRPSLDRIPFDKGDDIKSRAQMMLNFWMDCGRSDVWDNIYNAIEILDYDQLIQQLERLF
ncbi:kinase-like protein [Rhizophagus irregularis]|uniref:Kinase-like protein n=1 Tax=Rhizophagus irregularis TaxID=588596 RepID=A0A2N0PCN0_9GLOM|nr:kinase-like protein [Rhizophagus irregularis]